MSRFPTCLLAACAALPALAAPAPKPKAPEVWDKGWDKPTDPQGDCRFDRKGGKLTITVPGADHGLNVLRRQLNAPRLLRDVEGDFVLQVRVGGDFRPGDVAAGADAYRRAGILLTDGKTYLRVQRTANLGGRLSAYRLHASVEAPGRGSGSSTTGPPLDKPAYLRLERKGETFESAWSLDGKKWTRFSPGGVRGLTLERKLKVGVVAEATAPGAFKPEFDQLQLTLPGKPPAPGRRAP